MTVPAVLALEKWRRGRFGGLNSFSYETREQTTHPHQVEVNVQILGPAGPFLAHTQETLKEAAKAALTKTPCQSHRRKLNPTGD